MIKFSLKADINITISLLTCVLDLIDSSFSILRNHTFSGFPIIGNFLVGLI